MHKKQLNNPQLLELTIAAKNGLCKKDFCKEAMRILKVTRYKYYKILNENADLKELQLQAALNYKLKRK